ncbi:MAG: 50S ribosomal protein L10 [Phycisphaerae bacterium]|nr:50S ribosomal protein L10 [Phycisphaerae bacterium]
MSKTIKGYIQNELASTFDGINELMVVSLRGLTGNENNEFRGDLADKDITVKVVKNSLALRAFEDHGISGMENIMVGPCAIAYGGQSIVDVAKVLVDWAKKLKALEVKGGYLEGQVLDATTAADVSKMLTRAEQQGEVVMLAMSPGRSVAGAISGPAGIIAGCIKSIIEKEEEAA